MSKQATRSILEPNRWHMTKNDYRILKAMLSNLYDFLDAADKEAKLLGEPRVVETVFHIEEVEG